MFNSSRTGYDSATRAHGGSRLARLRASRAAATGEAARDHATGLTKPDSRDYVGPTSFMTQRPRRAYTRRRRHQGLDSETTPGLKASFFAPPGVTSKPKLFDVDKMHDVY